MSECKHDLTHNCVFVYCVTEGWEDMHAQARTIRSEASLRQMPVSRVRWVGSVRWDLPLRLTARLGRTNRYWVNLPPQLVKGAPLARSVPWRLPRQ